MIQAEKPENYILLVNPWIYDFTAYDLWLNPLGLLIISSYLKSHGLNTSMLNCLDRHHPVLDEYSGNMPVSRDDGTGGYISEPVNTPEALQGIKRRFKRYGVPRELLVKHIEKMNPPEAIFITSLMTYWYQGVIDIAEILHDRFPDVPIIIGGIYPYVYTEHASTHIPFAEIFTGTDLKEMLSLLKDKTGLKINSHNNPNMNELLPDFTILNKPDALPLITSYGCPHSCPFCLTPHRWGKFIPLSSGNVIDQIRTGQDKYNCENFAFYDDALLYKPEDYFYKIAEEYMCLNLKAGFHSPNGLFARSVDKRCAQYMYEMGFVGPRISYESSDSRLQMRMGKVKDIHLENAITNLRQAGFKGSDIQVYLLVGMPWQTVDGIENDMKYVSNLGGRIHLAYYSPIKGTPEGDRVFRDYLNDSDDPAWSNKYGFLKWHPELDEQGFRRIRNIKSELNRKNREADN